MLRNIVRIVSYKQVDDGYRRYGEEQKLLVDTNHRQRISKVDALTAPSPHLAPRCHTDLIPPGREASRLAMGIH